MPVGRMFVHSFVRASVRASGNEMYHCALRTNSWTKKHQFLHTLKCSLRLPIFVRIHRAAGIRNQFDFISMKSVVFSTSAGARILVFIVKLECYSLNIFDKIMSIHALLISISHYVSSSISVFNFNIISGNFCELCYLPTPLGRK